LVSSQNRLATGVGMTGSRVEAKNARPYMKFLRPSYARKGLAHFSDELPGA